MLCMWLFQCHGSVCSSVTTEHGSRQPLQLDRCDAMPIEMIFSFANLLRDGNDSKTCKFTFWKSSAKIVAERLNDSHAKYQ